MLSHEGEYGLEGRACRQCVRVGAGRDFQDRSILGLEHITDFLVNLLVSLEVYRVGLENINCAFAQAFEHRVVVRICENETANPLKKFLLVVLE